MTMADKEKNTGSLMVKKNQTANYTHNIRTIEHLKYE